MMQREDNIISLLEKCKRFDGSYECNQESLSIIGFCSVSAFNESANAMAVEVDFLFNTILCIKLRKMQNSKYAKIIKNLQNWVHEIAEPFEENFNVADFFADVDNTYFS